MRPILWRIHLATTAELFEHTGQDGRDRVKDVLLLNKGHLHIELVEIRGRAVSTRVFIAEAGRDLEIFVKARHHQQLFELLRCLRQGVEFAGVQAGGYQKVARAFRAAGRDDRCLELAEVFLPHPLADRGHHVRAEGHIGLHLLAPQVEVAIAQAGFFGVLLIAENLQWQIPLHVTQNFHVADVDFDLACWELFVDQALITGLHLTINADAPFATHLLNLGKNRAVRVAEHLGHAVGVTQVDEEDTTMIAHAVDPARQTDGITLV